MYNLQHTIKDLKLIAKDSIKNSLDKLMKNKKCVPIVYIIQFGNNQESNKYVSNKVKFLEEIGFQTFLTKADETMSKEDKLDLINKIDCSCTINKHAGVIVQLPAKDLTQSEIAKCINPKNDIDCFTEENFYKLTDRDFKLTPCTTGAILDILSFSILEKVKVEMEDFEKQIIKDTPSLNDEERAIKISEYLNRRNTILKSIKRVAIIGRSQLVGLPTFLALNNLDYTCTMFHSKSDIRDLSEFDVIVVAIGKAYKINAKNTKIKDGAIIIDVGINFVNKKMYGDVDMQSFEDKHCYITPVPFGVGQLTVTNVAYNALKLLEQKYKE